jgi:hypothetical protein
MGHEAVFPWFTIFTVVARLLTAAVLLALIVKLKLAVFNLFTVKAV